MLLILAPDGRLPSRPESPDPSGNKVENFLLQTRLQQRLQRLQRRQFVSDGFRWLRGLGRGGVDGKRTEANATRTPTQMDKGGEGRVDDGNRTVHRRAPGWWWWW